MPHLPYSYAGPLTLAIITFALLVIMWLFGKQIVRILENFAERQEYELKKRREDLW